MSTMRITENGRKIIANAFTSGASGSAKYWIGYYGLAYVNRSDSDEDISKVTTKLTQHGDYIYNIWQGDLTGTGFADDDDSGAKSLFGLTMYEKNICSNYRYVMDSDGNNNLVVWTSGGTGGAEDVSSRESYTVYTGYNSDTKAASKIPIPAPLFYVDDPLGASETITNPGDIDEAGFDAKLGGSSEGYSDLPHAGSDLPMVSSDARYYTGYTGAQTLEAFNDAVAISDDGYWFPSAYTRDMANGEKLEHHYATLRSISNYNLQHGTVSSEGYNLSSISACHNMSKATRLFPISHYQVLVDGQGANGDAETTSTAASAASSIKFSISLSPITRDRTYLDVTDNISSSATTDLVDDDDTNLFNTKKNRFKFNRIGIYAVQMEVRRFSAQSGSNTCSSDHVQFEIVNDADPILFAVADVNETIMSDSGNGTGTLNVDFILNMDSDSDSESQVINDTGIYYNLYENSAITWYENQLLASAGISEAVTGLGLDVANLKKQVAASASSASAVSTTTSSAASSVDMSQYAKVNHTHNFMKNLVDGSSNTGSIRGVNTWADGADDGTGTDTTYNLGSYTLAMGYNTQASGDFSIVQGNLNKASGDGNLVVGTVGSESSGDGNAIVGSEGSTTIDSGSTYNMVTAVQNGGVSLTGASGNLVFGLSVPKNGSESRQYSIGSAQQSVVFGTVPYVNGTAGFEDVSNSMESVVRSIVGINGNSATAGGMVSGIYDSLLLGITGIAKTAVGSVMITGSRGYGTENDSVIVGDSHNHSVQFAELVPGYATETTTDEYAVSAIADATVYGTADTNNLWIGSGDQYGPIMRSAIAGTSNVVGKWHLFNFNYGSGTAPIVDARSTVYGISLRGNANTVDYGTTNSVMLGDGNTFGQLAGSVVIGSKSNSSTEYAVEEYVSVDSFTDKYADSDPSRNSVIWLYNPASTASTITMGSAKTPVSIKSGMSAIIYQANGKWSVYNAGNKYNKYVGSPTKWGYTAGTELARAISAHAKNVQFSAIVGDNNLWGSDIYRSTVVGSGYDLRFAKLDRVELVGGSASGEALTIGAPSSPNATTTIRKQLSNVVVRTANSAILSAIGRLNNSLSDTYSNSFIFADGYASAKAGDLAGVFGTGSSYTGTAFDGSSLYNVNPLLKWSSATDGSLSSTWMHGTTEITAMTDDAVKAQLKPAGAMVYTNGIALMGTASDANCGLLKLGTTFAPYSTIATSPSDIIGYDAEWTTSGWDSSTFVGSKRGDIYDVKIAAGTTECPYAGRTLVIDHMQEADGTMHVKLGNYAAEPSLALMLARGATGGTLADAKSATNATYVVSGKVYTKVSGYVGMPLIDGLTARVYLDDGYSVGDLFATLNGISLEQATSVSAGWYRLTSIPTDNVAWTSTTVTKYAWFIEKITDFS